jgi:hypothetical protein
MMGKIMHFYTKLAYEKRIIFLPGSLYLQYMFRYYLAIALLPGAATGAGYFHGAGIGYCSFRDIEHWSKPVCAAFFVTSQTGMGLFSAMVNYC